MKQLVTPNPNIPCLPGWCLQYVRQTFGLPAVEPSATAGWHNTKFKHRDTNFPDDVWVPLWFSIDTIPEGHVVLRAPDGRIYSTSTNANTPYVHPNLEHLIWFYGPRVEPQYRLTLRYLGWSEDISNVRVVEEVKAQPERVKEWDEVASKEDFKSAIREVLTEGPVLDSIALAILKRPIHLVDPTGNTDEIVGTTTLARKGNYEAYLWAKNEQKLNLILETVKEGFEADDINCELSTIESETPTVEVIETTVTS